MLNRELNYKYPGMEPYVFISVSSDDLDRVEPFIDRLDREGIRRWYYVKGIEYSADYRSAFAERLKNCTTFLAFLSPNSAKSEDCRDEIYYARDNKKDMFFVYLDEPKSVKLPDGVEFIVHSKLYIEYQKSPTEEAFLRELCGAKCMQKCWKPAEEPHVPIAPEPQPVPTVQVSQPVTRAPKPQPAPKAKVAKIVYDPEKFYIDRTTLVKILDPGEIVVVPDGVEKIGNRAFYDDSIKQFDSLKQFKIKEIKLPESVKELGNDSISYCDNLHTINLPDGLEIIGDFNFAYCRSLVSVKIPNKVTTIGGGAFQGCEKMTNIELPERIQYIGDYSFARCDNLTIHMSRHTDTSNFDKGWNPDNRPIEYYD